MFITNLTIVTQNTTREIVPRGFIRITDGILSEIGSGEPSHIEAKDTLVNGHDYVVLPGFINAHVHLGETIYAHIVTRWHDLDTYIEHTNLACQLSRRIEQDRRIITDYSAARLLKTGTTTIAGGRTNESAERFGLRNVSAYMLMLSPKLGKFGDDIAGQFAIHEKKLDANLSTPAVFIHSLGTVSKDMLESARDIKKSQRDLVIMAHVGETADVEARSKNIFGLSSVETLAKYELLSTQTILIHGNHLSLNDKRLIKNSGASLVHCLSSNLHAADRVANIGNLVELDIPVSIATDGIATSGTFSVLSEAQKCYAYHNEQDRDASISAQEVLDMITIRPAEALNLSRERGSLTPGKCADLVFFRKEEHLSYSTPEEILRNLPEAPDHVMVNGVWLLYDKEIVHVDEHHINESFERTVRAVQHDLATTRV